MWLYFTTGPQKCAVPQGPPPPPTTTFQYHSPLRIKMQITDFFMAEGSFLSLIGNHQSVHVIGTNPYFRPILFNMNRTAGQAELIAQCFFKKSTIYCSSRQLHRKEIGSAIAKHLLYISQKDTFLVLSSTVLCLLGFLLRGELDFVFYSLIVLSQVSKSYTVLKTCIFIT